VGGWLHTVVVRPSEEDGHQSQHSTHDGVVAGIELTTIESQVQLSDYRE